LREQRLKNSLARVLRQLAPVAIVIGERRKKIDMHVDRVLRDYQQQRIQQGFVAIVGHLGAQRAVAAGITDRHRMKRGARVQRGLQQRAVKFEHFRSVAGHGFGKNRHRVSRQHRFYHQAIQPRGVVTPRTLDKQRSRFLAEPADYRPTAHLGLGDKPHRQHRIDGINIEPRNVIADQHERGAVPRRIAVDAQPDGKDTQQACRPVFDFVSPARWRHEGKKQSRDDQTAQHMKTRQHNPQNTRRA